MTCAGSPEGLAAEGDVQFMLPEKLTAEGRLILFVSY